MLAAMIDNHADPAAIHFAVKKIKLGYSSANRSTQHNSTVSLSFPKNIS